MVKQKIHSTLTSEYDTAWTKLILKYCRRKFCLCFFGTLRANKADAYLIPPSLCYCQVIFDKSDGIWMAVHQYFLGEGFYFLNTVLVVSKIFLKFLQRYRSEINVTNNLHHSNNFFCQAVFQIRWGNRVI